MGMNDSIIGRSFGNSAAEEGAGQGNAFSVEFEAGSGRQDAPPQEFTSDVVEGDFEAVAAKKTRPIKTILAGSLIVGAMLAGGAAYTATTLRTPKASDFDFGALKTTQSPQVAIAAPVAVVAPESAPSDTSVAPGPGSTATPAIGVAPVIIASAMPTTNPTAGGGTDAVAAPGPVGATSVPAGQGGAATPVATTIANSPAVVPAAPAPVAAAQPPVPQGGTPAQVPPVSIAMVSTQPAAQMPAAPAATTPMTVVAKTPAATAPKKLPTAHAANVQGPTAKLVPKVVTKPVSAVRSASLAATKPSHLKPSPLKPKLESQPLTSPPPDDSNPLGADVRPLVTVTAEQIGMRAMSADAISLATVAGIQRYKVGDYLPSGDRVMHIDSPGSILVTDKKIIRVLN